MHAYKYNPAFRLVVVFRVSALPKVLHNSSNMGTCDLPDMYAQNLWAVGIHIRQITRTHVTTLKYNPGAWDHQRLLTGL